ncbi:PTI1-like tyrosine-protein kinase 2 [Salvia hispanica]|uniref:PTI1-like tyrosine-protein kinase 2 n=1 Tax=Salvia hispanica TaxID=49212 RepID=UPI002009093E|nr:PTI1-like tyrosine-protein kinase 2 [Salvia hispanica]
MDYSAVNISHRNLHIDDRRGDVYNFGEILLELLTGSTLYDNTRREEGQHLLVPWALPQLYSKKVHEIVDGRLKGEYPPEAVKKMARLAQLCLQDTSHFRPNMGKVVQDLELCLLRCQITTLTELKPNHNARWDKNIGY